MIYFAGGICCTSRRIASIDAYLCLNNVATTREKCSAALVGDEDIRQRL